MVGMSPYIIGARLQLQAFQFNLHNHGTW